MKVELSENQKKIVYADNGPIYVKAAAGSGKTRVLTERVRYLLTQTNKKVLALTFTNKAGAEIKERISEIQDIEKRVFVGTFHSFCQTILENHGRLIGLDKMPHIFEDENDRIELIGQAINQTPLYSLEYRKKNDKEQEQFRYRVLNFISDVKRKLIPDSEIDNHTNDDNIILLYRNYQDILRAQNALDFDDLLLLAHTLLINFQKTAALYRRSFYSICVDEAQDLNNAQYQFLMALVNNDFDNILMVGDPNQSIYHFNGSSPDYMDKFFVKKFNPTIIELNENYRSSKSVLLAAQQIIANAEYITNTIKQGIFELKCLDDEVAESKWVIGKVNEFIKLKTHNDIEGEINLEKIAILARNKYIFNPLEHFLNVNSLPFYYKMTPGAIHFESEIMKIFDLALRVRLNPQDTLHKLRLFKKLEIDFNDSLELKDLIFETKNNQHKIITLVFDLADDGKNLKTTLEEFKSTIRIQDENEKFMVYNDIDELLKHWYNYASKTDNKSLHQFKNAMALGQTHPLSQHVGITLSTVHTMKGQEFDIVFLIGVDDETFPDYRAVRSGGVEMKQEINNMYVAFTRAKRFLFVTWPQKRKMPWGDYKFRKISRLLKGFNV